MWPAVPRRVPCATASASGIIDSGMNARGHGPVPRAAMPGRSTGCTCGSRSAPSSGPLVIGRLVVGSRRGMAGRRSARPASAAIAVVLRAAAPGHPGTPRTANAAPTGRDRGGACRLTRRRSRSGPVPLPVLLLAAAIACYVAIGDGRDRLARPLPRRRADRDATLALSLFWAGWRSAACCRRLSPTGWMRPVAVARHGVGRLRRRRRSRRSCGPDPRRSRLACFALAGFAAGPDLPDDHGDRRRRCTRIGPAW